MPTLDHQGAAPFPMDAAINRHPRPWPNPGVSWR